jgi:TolB-like protein|tara:strand:+ start:532 stop:3312 length:2781 start_codon:yes stop_codon:yes gene_type:complete
LSFTAIKLVAATLLVLLLGPVSSALGAGQPATGAAPASALVVVTFANVGGAPEDDWVGMGVAESLASTLGSGVTVPSLTAAEQPGVSRIVEGSYQRIGTRIRITALLTDVESGRVVGSGLVDGELNDLFALQDALAAQLVATPADPARIVQPGVSTLDSVAAERRIRPDGASPSNDAPAGRAGFAIGSGSIIDGPSPPTLPAMVARNARGQATMRATRITEAIALDGRLDERVYTTVPSVSDFIQQEPNEGAPASERTETWIFFDDDTIYISARCWDSQPARMIANEMRRDNLGIFQNENFAVVLDTFYDRRNGYMFHTNPLGGMFDGHITAGNMNRDWNGVWDVRTDRFDDGWTVEIAIPFKTVRFSPGTAQTWGVNLRRIVRWKNETSYLTAVPAAYGLAGIMRLSVAGAVVGVEAPPSSGNIEVKPYLISDLTTDRLASPPTANVLDGDAGFDVKYGVTQGLTADFTYNTDFAQVEVDEQQVNLTRFSLFFPEKREFFLEGQGIFDFGGGRGFSGRGPGLRVGGSGGGGSNTPILFFSRRIGLDGGLPVPIEAGGRLTGKVGAFSIGLLDIQTGDEASSGARPTNFGVVRIKRDILRRSAIGVLATHRSVALSGEGSNQLYGVDGTFAFYDNLNLNTYLARTETPGLDGDDLSYRGQFDYNGDRYGLQAERLVVDEHFNPEVGFLRRTDFQRSFASTRFSPRPASIASVRKLSWEGSFDYVTNDAGRVDTRIANAAFGIDLENSDQFLVEASHNYEFLAEPFDIATDVTIPVGGYTFTDTSASYAFGSQRRISGTFSASHGSFFGGTRTSAGVSRGRVGLTPQLSVEPGLSINWVDVPTGSFTATLLTSRATYTVNPRAFVSALLQYNSAAASLSTNIRLRWEYQPGSELFVVYTDQRDTLVPRFPELENRAIVVKVNRLFRF